MQVDIEEARNTLSNLVAAAERGEEVIIVRDGKPVAKIIRYQAPKVKPPGSMKGRIKVSPNWDSAETNAEIAALFDGAEPAPVALVRP